MAGGFDGQLIGLAKTVREWATKRSFEDEGWDVQTTDNDTQYDDQKPLTVQRYKQGVDHRSPHEFYVKRHSEVWNLKYDQLDWVTQTFTQFGQSDLGSLSSLHDAVKDVTPVLCANSMWLPRAESGLKRNFSTAAITGAPLLLATGLNELDHWSGEAASVFKTAFGAQGEDWRQILINDFELSQLLVAALEAQLAVTIATRKSIVTVGKKTIAALGLEDEGGLKTSTALFVIGAIGSAALTVASFGTLGAVFAAAFTVGGALAAEAESDGDVTLDPPVEPNGPPIGGDTAVAILDSMSKAISQLITDAVNEQGRIATSLNNAYNLVLQQRSKFEVTFSSGQTDFSGATESNARSDKYLGKRSMETHINDLKNAATTEFPEAAKPLFKANNMLNGLPITDAAFYSDFSPVVNAVKAPWTSVRDLLQDIVGNNGQTIQDTGQALLWGAQSTGAVDEATADAVEKSYTKYDVENSGRHHQPVTTTPSPLDKKLADR